MEAYLANSALGQPIFEFRSVSRFQGRCGGAGLIFIPHYTRIFVYFRGYKCWKIKIKMRCRINLTFKKDEKCELVVILGWLPWAVNSDEAGGHRSKPKVVLGLDQHFGFFCFEANVLVYHYIIIIDVILPISLQLYLSYMKLIKLAIVASHCRHYTPEAVLLAVMCAGNF